MAVSQKDIRKLAQVLLRDKGFYSGEIDGLWGKGSNAAFADYNRFLREAGLEIGSEDAIVEDSTVGSITGVVVLDPGHGGKIKTGGSSANNATSVSGVPEKTMTLELAKQVRKELNKIAAGRPGSNIKVHLTRADDSNLGLADRAKVARTKGADVFLSIHYNGFDGRVRGTETLILSRQNGNVNVADDKALAERVQSRTFAALNRHDPQARNRGVKDNQRLGVLKDVHLQNPRADLETRACLVEVEFIDVDVVDKLLNTGPNTKNVRLDVARAIAEAIAEDLEAHT
ncbi:MAG: N-acetylmuramoyl-L-alanine amidase [Gammaproteobacteria bacterium]|nr:N-acetylmuramoyl-L-alanine amidase [Gammaproteobacteria bacterium]